jgi:hypothetical protein
LEVQYKKEVELLINEIKSAGFPEKYGLAENNIIMRRHNSSSTSFLIAFPLDIHISLSVYMQSLSKCFGSAIST